MVHAFPSSASAGQAGRPARVASRGYAHAVALSVTTPLTDAPGSASTIEGAEAFRFTVTVADVRLLPAASVITARRS